MSTRLTLRVLHRYKTIKKKQMSLSVCLTCSHLSLYIHKAFPLMHTIYFTRIYFNASNNLHLQFFFIAP